jgi:nondiscriminating glutamyl-tRNA synthetase
MNGNYIRQLSEDNLVNFLTPYLKKSGADISDKEKTRKIILAVYKKIDKCTDVYNTAEIFYKDDLEISEAGALEVLKQETSRTVLETFLAKARSLEILDMNTFRLAMKEVQTETGIKGPALWQPVRAALTGMLAGPELPVVIEVFGKDKVTSFIRQVLEKYL